MTKTAFGRTGIVNTRPILWTYAPKKDGRCDIKIYVSHLGRKSYVSTNIKILPSQWNKKKGVVNSVNSMSSRYNGVIASTIRKIEDHFFNGGSWRNFNNGDTGGDLIAFCETFIKEADQGLFSLTKGTLNNYRSTLRRLREYSKKEQLNFNAINMEFYYSFTSFLNDSCDCGLPGIGKHFKIIKRLMSLSLNRNLHTNRIHEDEKFKVYRKPLSKQLFLSRKEIEALENVDLTADKHLERERNRWLIAYYFLMRFSDVCRISREMVFKHNGQSFIRYKSQKTKTESILPLSQKANHLLEKHNYQLSFSGNPQANRAIKIVADLAGIHGDFDNGLTIGSRHLFVKTHTARRSAATNLHLEGCSTQLIANLGGWKKLDQLQVYLKASALDNALIAANLDHFNS